LPDGRDGGKIDVDGASMQRRTKNTGKFSHLPELMQLSHVKAVAKKFGIDLTGEHIRIERDEGAINSRYFGEASPGYKGRGRIHLLPDAFSSEEELARTLYHEKIHLDQYEKHGYEYVMNNNAIFEDEAELMENEYFSKWGGSSL
jgi:hypothetical protein